MSRVPPSVVAIETNITEVITLTVSLPLERTAMSATLPKPSVKKLYATIVALQKNVAHTQIGWLKHGSL